MPSACSFAEIAISPIRSDVFLNAAVQIIRQAARKTVEQAGDGTTTSIVLTYEILNRLNAMLNEGSDMLELKWALGEELKLCVDFIRSKSHKLVTDGALDLKKVQEIAAISANNDDSIGKLFYEAYQIIGPDGIVMLDKSRRPDSWVEAVKGMKIDRGFENSNFCNRGSFVLHERPAVYVTDKVITQQKDIINIADHCFKLNIPLVIYSAGLHGEALAFLVDNIARQSGFEAAAVTIPNYLRDYKEILKDIAIYTGAKYCSEDEGFNIEAVRADEMFNLLGHCEKFKAAKKDSLIIGGAGRPEDIAARVAYIDSQITPEISDYDRETLLGRKSKLTSGIAVLYAGGQTEVQQKETLDRCEDAILAVRSAIEEGYLPGGGRVHLALGDLLWEKYGTISVLQPCMQSVLNKICENAGVDANLYGLELSGKPLETGYNAKTGNIENLLESGVVDSAKVIRASLESAVSVALAFLNTECLIVEVQEPSKIQL
jgi:chaperonin GroEL